MTGENKLKHQRINEIEQYIRLNKHVSLNELCDKFEVSMNTIRRDVNEIVKNEAYKKVYGGVEFTGDYLLPFEDRNERASLEKEKIASRAANQINSGDVIFIDSGTTTQYIPDFLPLEIELTVLTNSLNIINKICRFPNVRLIIIGELYKRKTNSFVGIKNDSLVNKYNVHKAFMAATAASIEAGLTNSDNQEYYIKNLFVKKASVSYALLDYEKFGSAALVTYAQLNEIDVIITNKQLPNSYQSYMEENEITVLLP